MEPAGGKCTRHVIQGLGCHLATIGIVVQDPPESAHQARGVAVGTAERADSSVERFRGGIAALAVGYGVEPERIVADKRPGVCWARRQYLVQHANVVFAHFVVRNHDDLWDTVGALQPAVKHCAGHG